MLQATRTPETVHGPASRFRQPQVHSRPHTPHPPPFPSRSHGRRAWSGLPRGSGHAVHRPAAAGTAPGGAPWLGCILYSDSDDELMTMRQSPPIGAPGLLRCTHPAQQAQALLSARATLSTQCERAARLRHQLHAGTDAFTAAKRLREWRPTEVAGPGPPSQWRACQRSVHKGLH